MPEPISLLGGGAIIAGLYACWDYIKMYLSKIYGLFVVRIQLSDDSLKKADEVVEEFKKRFKKGTK